jgi:hypothetical protein
MTLGLLAPGSPKLSYQDKEEEIEDMLMLCIMSTVLCRLNFPRGSKLQCKLLC